MTSEVRGDDELDGSLFEGMILFSPSDLLPTGLPQEKGPEVPYQDQMHPPQRHRPPLSPSTASSTSCTSPRSKSKPLDDDLFSDLVLQIPIEPAHPLPVAFAPAPSLSAPSRQISRKKKRALRIGYGREAIDTTPVVSVNDFQHLTEDDGGIVRSDSIPLYADHNEELPDRSVYEEVEASEMAVVVTADGEGLSPSRSGDPEGDEVEVLPSTMDASQKDASLESIEEKLNLLKSEIYAKVYKVAISVYAEKKELERRRRKAGQDVNQAMETYKDLEKQLEKACEDEEFETAERVSESLATIEKEKDILLDILRAMELDCDSVDSRMLEVLELQVTSEEEGIKSLEQFAKDAIDQSDLIHKDAEELSSKELDEWQSSLELLEVNKLELDIEAEFISDARSELYSCIEDLVKDEREEIEGLTRKRVVLAEELEELRKLVRLKEAEIAENESRIEEVEKKMSEVSSNFQDASSSISMKHGSLKSSRSMIYSERERLSSKKNEIDKFISLAEQRCSTLRGIATIALNDAKTFQDMVGLRKHLASSILESREYKVQLVRTEEKVLEEIQILRQQISSARTSLQELSSNRATVQEDMDSLKHRIAFVEKRGPELESEKKVAAAARNFREAGRIAAEAKNLNSEKRSLQHKMQKAVLDLEKLEGDIKGSICRMHDNEELVSLKEKEAAVVSFRRLRLIAAAAREERSVALELGDSEESDFLSKEVDAAEERARELQEAYGLDPKDNAMTGKYFFPVALITKFSEQSLAEMAASLKPPVADE